MSNFALMLGDRKVITQVKRMMLSVGYLFKWKYWNILQQLLFACLYSSVKTGDVSFPGALFFSRF